MEQAGNSGTASLAEMEQTELSLGRLESSRGSGRQGGNTNSKNSMLVEEIGLVQGKEKGRKHSIYQGFTSSLKTPTAFPQGQTMQPAHAPGQTLR